MFTHLYRVLDTGHLLHALDERPSILPCRSAVRVVQRPEDSQYRRRHTVCPRARCRCRARVVRSPMPRSRARAACVMRSRARGARPAAHMDGEGPERRSRRSWR
jgi:hypothetical protein